MSWIDALNGWAGAWPGAIIRASWQGGLALLIVWGVSRFVKVVPAHVKVWLWRIGYCKLLLAFFCSTAIEVPILPRPPEAAAATPTASDLTIGPVQMKAADNWRTPIRSGFSQAAKLRGLEFSALLLLLWLLGVLSCGLRLLCHWRRAAGIRRNSVAPANPLCQSLCDELAAQFGLRRAPSVLQSQSVNSPVLIGTFGPAIILPAESFCALSPKQLRLILAHELAHLRRRDLLWLWLSVVAEALFFFHPLAWLARRESSLMQEVSCDELALRAVSAQASDYGAMLLDFVATKHPQPRAALIALGIFETRGTIKRRLLAMKQFRVHSAKHYAAAVAAVLIFSVTAVLPWRVVAQNEPGSRDEVTRLKEENAKLRDNLSKLKAEIRAMSKEMESFKEPTAELERTKQHLEILLQQYSQEHPQVKETQEKIAALGKMLQAERALLERQHAVQRKIEIAKLEEQRKEEELLARRELAQLQRHEAKREELKQLIREEIGLVEKQLEEARKRVQVGTHPPESLIPLQREILKLKRELALIE